MRHSDSLHSLPVLAPDASIRLLACVTSAHCRHEQSCQCPANFPTGVASSISGHVLCHAEHQASRPVDGLDRDSEFLVQESCIMTRVQTLHVPMWRAEVCGDEQVLGGALELCRRDPGAAGVQGSAQPLPELLTEDMRGICQRADQACPCPNAWHIRACCLAAVAGCMPSPCLQRRCCCCCLGAALAEAVAVRLWLWLCRQGQQQWGRPRALGPCQMCGSWCSRQPCPWRAQLLLTSCWATQPPACAPTPRWPLHSTAILRLSTSVYVQPLSLPAAKLC